jgi:hypothetical protein
MYVVLVRLPALASTKLDLLLGTLQGVAVALLFAIAALLISIAYMIGRANRAQPFASVDNENRPVRVSEPSA